MYVKSENLKKIEKLSEEITPMETVCTRIVDVLEKVKRMLDDKKVSKESIKQEVDFIIETVQKIKK